MKLKILWHEKMNVLAVHEPDDMLSYLTFLEIDWSEKPIHCWGLKMLITLGWVEIGEV